MSQLCGRSPEFGTIFDTDDLCIDAGIVSVSRGGRYVLDFKPGHFGLIVGQILQLVITSHFHLTDYDALVVAKLSLAREASRLGAGPTNYGNVPSWMWSALSDAEALCQRCGLELTIEYGTPKRIAAYFADRKMQNRRAINDKDMTDDT